MKVGRVPVYLLDTDLEENDPADRDLCRQAVRRRPDPAAAPGMDARRRRRPGAARAGHGSRRLARQRGPRRVHAGRAAARTHRARARSFEEAIAAGAGDAHLHDAHAGAGRPRCLRRTEVDRVHRAGLGGDGRQPGGVPRAGLPSRTTRPRPVPHGGAGRAAARAGSTAWPSATARSRAGSGTNLWPGRPDDQVPIGARHQRRPPRRPGCRTGSWRCSTTTSARTGGNRLDDPALWDACSTSMTR